MSGLVEFAIVEEQDVDVACREEQRYQYERYHDDGREYIKDHAPIIRCKADWPPPTSMLERFSAAGARFLACSAICACCCCCWRILRICITAASERISFGLLFMKVEYAS